MNFWRYSPTNYATHSLPIKNSLYILDRAAAGGEQARRALGVIDRQATQLSNLVNDLLDVTRINSQQDSVGRSSVLRSTS